MSIARRLQIFSSLGEIYHSTDVGYALKMLQENRTKLSTNLGSVSDQGATVYFLSMTRSKLGSYHQGTQKGAMLVLDPDYLMSFGKLGPVDYWGREFRLVQPTHNEMEERLWSKKQFIPLPKPASKLIKAIHVVRVLPDAWGDRFQFMLRRLWLEAKRQGIKFYFYNNQKDWLLQRKERAIPFEQAKSQLIGPEVLPSGSGGRDSSRPWRELYYATDKAKLSKRTQQIWQNTYYRPDEAKTSLMADIHNMRTDPRIGKLINLIQKHGGIKLFIEYLGNKFK
jgi:hypothetical protein